VNPQQILKSSLFYTVVQYLVLGIGFIKGIYIARYLGPALMGSYGLILLVLEYLRFSNLGISSAMNLEVSVNRSREEKREYVECVINTAFSYILVVALLLGIAALLVHFLFSSWVASEVLTYLFAIFYIAFVGQMKLFCVVYARLYQKYRFINLIEFVSAAILCMLVVLLVADYRLDAVIGSMIVSSTLTLVLCFLLVRGRVQFHLGVRLLRSLAVVGVPLLVYNLCERVFQTIDRLMIVHFLTREDLGYFTLAYTVLSNTLLILGSFTYLQYPRFLEKFNISNYPQESRGELFHDLKRYSSSLSGVCIGITIVGLLLIEPFIRILLPAYAPSILLYRILIVGIVFDVIAYFASAFLVSNKHQILLIVTLAVASLVAAGLNLVALRSGWGLAGIAVATTISMALYAALKVSLVLRKIGQFSLQNLAAFYSKYLLFLLLLVPLMIGYPSYLFLAVPVFLVIYFSDLSQLARKLRLAMEVS